jgi:hypothetical protein
MKRKIDPASKEAFHDDILDQEKARARVARMTAADATREKLVEAHRAEHPELYESEDEDEQEDEAEL